MRLGCISSQLPPLLAYFGRLEDLRDEYNFQKLSLNVEDLEYLFAEYQSIQNYSPNIHKKKFAHTCSQAI